MELQFKVPLSLEDEKVVEPVCTGSLIFNMFRRTLLAGVILHKALKVKVIDQNIATEYILVHQLSHIPIMHDATGTYHLKVRNDGKDSIMVWSDSIEGSEKLFPKKMFLFTIERGGYVDLELTVTEGVCPYLAGGNDKFRTVNAVSFETSGKYIVATVSSDGTMDLKQLMGEIRDHMIGDLDMIADVADGKDSDLVKYTEDGDGFIISVNLLDKYTSLKALREIMSIDAKMIKEMDQGSLRPWYALAVTYKKPKELLKGAVATLKSAIMRVEW